MKNQKLIILMLTLALAAVNAAPLSAVVTCGMSEGAPGQGCSCDHGTCCPDEARGLELNARCCTVTLPETVPVETAPVPTTQSDREDVAPLSPVIGAEGPRTAPSFTPLDPAAPPPEESPPRYALLCTYLI